MVPNTKHLIVDATEFFDSSLSEAETRLKITIKKEIRLYLVNLLKEFISPTEKNEIFGQQSFLDSSLFEIWDRIIKSENSAEKLTLLKGMGDISLFLSGFFQDYFNRKLFDLSYFIDMGQMAYGTAAPLSAHYQNSAPFQRLSETFPLLVDLLAETAEKTSLQQTSAHRLLSLYDRWNKTKSDRLFRILVEAGIDPIENKSKFSA